MTATISTVLVLATLVEALVEYLIRPLVKPVEMAGGGGQPPEIPERAADLVLRYSAAAVGLVLCVVYQADLLALLGLSAPIPYAGAAITGLLIGRGANYVHDFANRWLTWPGARP